MLSVADFVMFCSFSTTVGDSVGSRPAFTKVLKIGPITPTGSPMSRSSHPFPIVIISTSVLPAQTTAPTSVPVPKARSPTIPRISVPTLSQSTRPGSHRRSTLVGDTGGLVGSGLWGKVGAASGALGVVSGCGVGVPVGVGVLDGAEVLGGGGVADGVGVPDGEKG